MCVAGDLTLFSPAKINLFLRVLGKRSDGYHDLASLFQTINLGDLLTFRFSKQDSFTCSDPNLCCDVSNLVIKALHLFRQKTGLQFSINIHLEKKIPTQAGLGGGSSNAATTLWALNALHNKPYTDLELQIWSAEIGSDIPFFFSLGTAYRTGRGEIVRNVLPINLPSLTLFKPSEGISTPKVYNALQLERCSCQDPENLLENFYKQRFTLVNDLEEPAFRLLPALYNYKKLLEKHCSLAAMTGSGTAFFGLNKNINSMLHSTINRTPLDWYYFSVFR